MEDLHNISPMVLMQQCCHLVNEQELMAAKEKQCHIFGCLSGTPGAITNKTWDTVSRADLSGTPGAITNKTWDTVSRTDLSGTPGAITNKTWDTVSRTDLSPTAKFQPNPFSSFVGDTILNRQTDSKLNPLIATLKPQSNGPSYSNTVIGTLAVDWWAVTFGTARRGLGGAAAHTGPSSLYQM